MTHNEIEMLQRRGVKWITTIGWAATFAIGLLAVQMGEQAMQACLVSAALNLFPSMCALRSRSDLGARMGVALMAAMQPALLLYAMRGAAWQIDMHMYFFVGLAMLTILCDARPILAAALAIAAHHLLLAFVSPDWVFSGGGGFGRVLIHALAVVLQAGALSIIAIHLHSILSRLGEALQASEAAKADATDALRMAEEERAKRGEMEHDQANRRRAELIRIAQEFEGSVAAVAASVVQSTRSLDTAMDSLDQTVRDTGRQASEVAASASKVSAAVESVANGVAELSRSIGSIAVTAGEQDQLANEAGERSSSGGKAMSTLSNHSKTIAEATKSIAGVAEKTNLLALNAAIEAASAGNAGKGFAVVANEVKELAGQAARATQQIDDLLRGVRDGTGQAEISFEGLSKAISELAGSAAAIRRDVDGQRGAAATIETNAGQTAIGTDEMARLSALLADRAGQTERLFDETRSTTRGLVDNVRLLERSASEFVTSIKAA